MWPLWLVGLLGDKPPWRGNYSPCAARGWPESSEGLLPPAAHAHRRPLSTCPLPSHLHATGWPAACPAPPDQLQPGQPVNFCAVWSWATTPSPTSSETLHVCPSVGTLPQPRLALGNSRGFSLNLRVPCVIVYSYIKHPIFNLLCGFYLLTGPRRLHQEKEEANIEHLLCARLVLDLSHLILFNRYWIGVLCFRITERVQNQKESKWQGWHSNPAISGCKDKLVSCRWRSPEPAQPSHLGKGEDQLHFKYLHLKRKIH